MQGFRLRGFQLQQFGVERTQQIDEQRGAAQ